MKTFLFLFSMILVTSGIQAQNGMPDFSCPPGAWCHPDGAGLGTNFLDAATAAADAVGKAMQGDPCGDQSYAEQVYCYIGEAVSGVIACMYGEDTPQHTLCEEGDGAGESAQNYPNSESQRRLGKIKNNFVAMDTKVLPRYFKSKNGTKAIEENLKNLKRGDIVKKYKNGYTLSLFYKFYTKEGKGAGAFFRLKDNKGNVLSTPLVINKDNVTYIYATNYSSRK